MRNEPCLMKAEEARRLAYEFLARAFRREPDENFLTALRSKPSRSLLETVAVPRNVVLTLVSEALDLDALEEEYCRLFIGPPALVSPYESLHASGPGNRQLFGDAAVSMKRFVELLGLSYREDKHDLPDHLSIELELMARLVGAEAEARSVGNESEARVARRIQGIFMRKHLAVWVPVFFRQLRASARHPFYAALAEWGARFLDQEKVLLAALPAPDAVGALE